MKDLISWSERPKTTNERWVVNFSTYTGTKSTFCKDLRYYVTPSLLCVSLCLVGITVNVSSIKQILACYHHLALDMINESMYRTCNNHVFPTGYLLP